MPKNFKYHKCYSFKDVETGKEFTFQTQLYQTGIYGIYNNDPSMQGSFKPSRLVKNEKTLRKLESENKITDLKFIGEIVVTTDENGFFIEKK